MINVYRWLSLRTRTGWRDLNLIVYYWMPGGSSTDGWRAPH